MPHTVRQQAKLRHRVRLADPESDPESDQAIAADQLVDLVRSYLE
jgi:hypothetical protein